jgi:transposase
MRERSRYNWSMNQLSIEERARILSALVEGNSIRSVCRMLGVAKRTVTRLLVEVGTAC